MTKSWKKANKKAQPKNVEKKITPVAKETPKKEEPKKEAPKKAAKPFTELTDKEFVLLRR